MPDLAGSIKTKAGFMDIAFQQLKTIPVISCKRRWPRSSARFLRAPAAQRLRRAAYLACDRGHCRPFRTIVCPMLVNHPDRSIGDLR
jgi:hypothetical protein